MYFKFIIIFFLLFVKQSIESEIDENILNKLKDLFKDVSIDQLLNDDLKSLIDYENEIIDQQPIKESVKDLANVEPDQFFNATQMIEYRGFKYEQYEVVTEDCYILTLHRIINPIDNTPDKPPVLLLHGLADDSTEWIRNSIGGMINDTDDRNLGFALAKRGYDVWLGNFRGNTYSNKHTKFSRFNQNYYKFSYDNHGLQDIPAMVGKIQNVTNFDQIEYVGYSQGTSAMFVLLSLKPEASSVFSSFVGLAPFAFGNNVKSPVRDLAYIPDFVKTFLYANFPIFTNNFIYKTVFPLLCRLFEGKICEAGAEFLTGYSDDQTNSTRLPVYFENFPAGTSIPSIARFAQTIINGGKSEMLNYMSEKNNMKCYNSSEPFKVPLENINLETIYLIYGLSDTLATPENVEKIKESLTVKLHYRPVDVKEFSHTDFIFSENIDKLVNDDVIEVLNLHKPSKSKNGLRFKQFTAETCHLPDTETFCHISDVNSVLNNIF